MALTLDHVVLAVDDLDAASATMRAEGFTVMPGGVHGSGATENALIVFADGTYIELLAPTGKQAADGANYMPFLAHGEGWSGYALHSDNLKKEVQTLRSRGVEVNDVVKGGRVTPNGDELRWQSAFLPGSYAPFYIQDETPRTLRVPETKPVTTHRNGVTGVIGMVFVVASLEDAITRYRNLLGTLPRLDDEDAVFDLRGVALTFTPAGDDEDKQAHLADRGDVLYQLKLRSREVRPGGIPTRKILGARIDIAPRGAGG